VRVLVADDSALLRAAMTRVLAGAGFEVVGQASDAAELLRKARAHRPEVAVVEAGMLPAAAVIRGELPGVGVLLFTQCAEARYASELLEHGARGVGYLVKDRAGEIGRFTEAVRQVGSGGTAIDAEVIERLSAPQPPAGALGVLDAREREVLARIAEGLSNRGIAQRMYLSERAIERHVTGIFRKLGISGATGVHRRVLAVLAHSGRAG
jgi:DNA-binding NarL/FixJ family response regulator